MTSTLQLALDQRGAVTVLTLEGMVDATSVDALRTELERLSQQGNARVVLDASRLTFINSLGYGVLFRLAHLCRARGGIMIFAGMPEKMRNVFRILGLEQGLVFAEDVETALARAAAGGKP